MSLTITESVESSRLSCRISAGIKKRAEDVFAKLGVIRLSERDFDLFVRTINADMEITPKMKQAAEEYKQFRRENPNSNW